MSDAVSPSKLAQRGRSEASRAASAGSVGAIMWRALATFLIAVVVGACASTSKTRSAPETIVGVWNVAELAARAPGGAWESRGAPSRSQYIFTSRHYSYLYVRGSAPRKTFNGNPNNPTDAEKVAAYDSIVAASGSYTLSGHSLTLTALLHKNPNEMTGEPLHYTIELDGDTLTMIVVDPPFLPGREWRTMLTRVAP